MNDQIGADEPPRKRAKVEGASSNTHTNISSLNSLSVPITPPQRKAVIAGERLKSSSPLPEITPAASILKEVVSSPFQLTAIRDLPPALNTDAVTLKDLLSDPLISECWEFNYLHDADMLMESFDPDVRDLVIVHIVHGFWKSEEGIGLKMQASKYANVTLHTAYMPEPFGTHHTKMMVLLRHDDLAQIIIHTANLIRRDWTNMSQAVWRSPLLPLLGDGNRPSPTNPVMGSGDKFKIDFLNYLQAYDTKRTICKPLIERLVKHNFTAIRGALVASVPGKHSVDSNSETKWGWQALREVLSSVPVGAGGNAEIVVQISSIATLGQTDQWLQKTLFKSLATAKSANSLAPIYKVIFPTADEIRRSLDGYQSGASIHTKIQTPAQVKQLQYLKPILCHWAGDGTQHPSSSAQNVLDAGRKRAAPHIKTYIRFGDAPKSLIDWALVTSANISKQAWGETVNAMGEVRICSYELGVLVWPQLFGEDVEMVPTFKQDKPPLNEHSKTVVALRMPYDLPLVPYSIDDKPWCATANHAEPDWRGQTWP